MSVNNFSADVVGKMLQIGNKKFNMRSIELFCKRKKLIYNLKTTLLAVSLALQCFNLSVKKREQILVFRHEVDNITDGHSSHV